MESAQILPQEDAAMCWRCGTEVDDWLRVLPVPRATDTMWCLHCYIEVHARLDADSSNEESVTVEIDIDLLLYVATDLPPKVSDGVGKSTVPRLMRDGWELEGGSLEVPTAEVERLRLWWPRLMAHLEGH